MYIGKLLKDCVHPNHVESWARVRESKIKTTDHTDICGKTVEKLCLSRSYEESCPCSGIEITDHANSHVGKLLKNCVHTNNIILIWKVGSEFRNQNERSPQCMWESC